MKKLKERTWNVQPKVYIEANRDGYGTDSIRTCTVGELIGYLEDFDEDAKVYLSHDNGYTYGGIYQNRIYAATADEGDAIEEIADILREDDLLADDVDPEDIAEDIYDIMRDSGIGDYYDAVDNWVSNAKISYPELLKEHRKSSRRDSKRFKEEYLADRALRYAIEYANGDQQEFYALNDTQALLIVLYDAVDNVHTAKDFEEFWTANREEFLATVRKDFQGNPVRYDVTDALEEAESDVAVTNLETDEVIFGDGFAVEEADRNDVEYTIWIKETEKDPIKPMPLEAKDIFDAIRILEDYSNVEDVKADVAESEGLDIAEVNARDAAYFWAEVLDSQDETWDRIWRIEGPDFEWEVDDFDSEYDDYDDFDDYEYDEH